MTRRSAALAAAVLVALAEPAVSAEPGEYVSTCADLTAGGGDRRTGVLYGGPIAISGDGVPRTGRLTCSLQDWGPFSATDHVSVTSPTTTGFVALAPTPVDFAEYDAWQVAICTSVEIDGVGTFYLHNETGSWSPDPETFCGPFVGDPEWDPLGPLFEVYDPWIVEQEVDPLVCPWFAVVAPPQGDLYVADTFVWDCPPYEEGTS